MAYSDISDITTRAAYEALDGVNQPKYDEINGYMGDKTRMYTVHKTRSSAKTLLDVSFTFGTDFVMMEDGVCTRILIDPEKYAAIAQEFFLNDDIMYGDWPEYYDTKNILDNTITLELVATEDNSTVSPTPDTSYGSDVIIVPDSGMIGQGLVKFDLSTVPEGAIITGACITLNIETQDGPWKLHRMLIDWSESSTYNSLSGGISIDGTDAVTIEECENGVGLSGGFTGKTVNIMLPQTIQDQIDGVIDNYGYVISSADYVEISSSEATTSTDRPKLVLTYTT